MRRVPCMLIIGTLALLVAGCPGEGDDTGINVNRPKGSPTPRATATPPASSEQDVNGGISNQGQVTPPPAGSTVTPSPSPTPSLRPLDEPGGNATPPPATPTPSIDPFEGSEPG